MTTTPARLPALDHTDPGHQQITYDRAVSRIQDQLSEPDMPVQFVDAAEQRLRAMADTLVGDIGVAATKIAGEERATVVDRQHVNKAFELTTAKPSKLKDLWWALFGVFAGSAISFGTTAVTDSVHRFAWCAATIACFVAAVTLLVLSLRSSS